MAALVLALAVAAPAWATLSATATLAPIGSGAYLLTLTNTGSETITRFSVQPDNPTQSRQDATPPHPTNVIPSPACLVGFKGEPLVALEEGITCNIAVTPGGSAQMCYAGRALKEIVPGSSLVLKGATPTLGFGTVSPTSGVAACPLAGFKGSGSASSPTKCVVPELKGKTLTQAKKSLSRANCKLGKVTKPATHKHTLVVVSQKPAAKKSLPGGAKVRLRLG